jgi:transmembrane sensor
LGDSEHLIVLIRANNPFMNQEQIWNLIARKLSGEASPDELEHLAMLLRNNPDLHYPIQTIADLWNHSQHKISQVPENAFNRHLDRLEELNIDFDAAKLSQNKDTANESAYLAPRNKRIRIALLWIPGLFILLWGSIILSKYVSPNLAARQNEPLTKNPSEIYTRNGSKTNVILPDGTVVKLNAGSKLTYNKDYGNTLREVNLTGEAFFEVVKNKEKPFIIHTKKIDIRVLGTVFNVKSYPNEPRTETSLVKGSIEVTFKDRPAEKVILKPNEKLIVTDDDPSLPALAKVQNAKSINDPIISVSHLNYSIKDSTIIETAWVQNKLVFNNESFKELALQMERWYNVTIQFGDPENENFHFTGSFENETIQQALNALKLSAKFNYQIRNNEIIISK